MNNVATSVSNSASFALASKVKDYFQLVKFTLSFTVVFSCVVCYLLSPNIQFNLLSVLLLFVAGMLITGSANAINQIEEKDTDALMKRTANRPVSCGKNECKRSMDFCYYYRNCRFTIDVVLFQFRLVQFLAYSVCFYMRLFIRR